MSSVKQKNNTLSTFLHIVHFTILNVGNVVPMLQNVKRAVDIENQLLQNI